MSDPSVSLAAVFRRMAKRFESKASRADYDYDQLLARDYDRPLARAKRDIYLGVADELFTEADILEGNEDPSEP